MMLITLVLERINWLAMLLVMNLFVLALVCVTIGRFDAWVLRVVTLKSLCIEVRTNVLVLVQTVWTLVGL